MRTLILTTLTLLASASFAADKPAIDPKTATLEQAVENWITLIEKDDLKTAAAQWAATPKAAREMESLWEQTKKAHQKHDYRTWLGDKAPDGPAGKIGDKTSFKVGGHNYNHIHNNWEKTNIGWRITSVAMCR